MLIPTTNKAICVDDPIETPNVMSCGEAQIVKTHSKKKMLKVNVRKLTSLSFMANVIALAWSTAFPTSGSKITLINESGIFNAIDVPCKTITQSESW